jgi:hypothetical protein
VDCARAGATGATREDETSDPPRAFRTSLVRLYPVGCAPLLRPIYGLHTSDKGLIRLSCEVCRYVRPYNNYECSANAMRRWD